MIEFNPGKPSENDFGEKYYESVSGNLFEQTASSIVFNRYYKDTFSKENVLYVVIGTDSGLLPFYIAEKFAEKREGRKFLFIDFTPVFEGIDISGLPEWVEVYPEEFPLEILAHKEVDYMASGNLSLCRTLSVIDSDFDGVYGQLARSVEDRFHKLLFADNVTSSTKAFINSQLLNLHRNIQPIKKLRKKLLGRDVLIIGGGPSLDEDIEWIKENSQKLIILAAARTSSRLQKEGIIPDFIVSVDPHDLSFDNSKQMLLFDQNTILLNCFHISPKLLNQWALNAAYFSDALPWGESEENSSSPGPTVIHSAIHQTVFMGARKIYLSGVDLCFKGNKTHASGSAEGNVGKLGALKRLTQVETYSGEMADTDQAFASGVDAMVRLVQGYKDLGIECQIFNLNCYAAKVAGIEYLDRNEIEFDAESDKCDLFAELNSILNVSKELMLQHLNSSIKELENKQALMEEVIELAENGSTLSTEFTEEGESNNALIEAKFALEEKLGEMGEILYHYGIEYFREAFLPLEDEQKMSEAEIKMVLDAYFNGMAASSKAFLSQINLSLKVLYRRVKEFSDELPMDELVSDWIDHQEPGRFKIWQGYHLRPFSEMERLELENAKSAFLKIINQTETRQAQRIKAKSESPVELHQHALKAYEKNDAETLYQIKEQLQGTSKYEAMQLSKLVSGMLLDLEGQQESAMLMYQEVEFKPFRLFTLKRVLENAIQHNQHEDALILLEELCSYSLDYMLPYSDYLALLGHIELSFNVLQIFLQNQPEHLMAWLKLSQLALQLERKDEAIRALESAQKLDPDNPQLHKLLNDIA